MLAPPFSYRPVPSCLWALSRALQQGWFRVGGLSYFGDLMFRLGLVSLNLWLAGTHWPRSCPTWRVSSPRPPAAQSPPPPPRLSSVSCVVATLLDSTQPVRHHGPSEAVLSFSVSSLMAPQPGWPASMWILLHPLALNQDSFAVALVSLEPPQALQLSRTLQVSGLVLVSTRARTRFWPVWTRLRDDPVSSFGSVRLAPYCRLVQLRKLVILYVPYQ